MGCSKDAILGQNPWVATPRTCGPLGTNRDAGDPDTPPWFVGDTPGPLGCRDHADPNCLMFRFRSQFEPNAWPLLLPVETRQCSEPVTGSGRNESFSVVSKPTDPTVEWVAQQTLSRAEVQQLIREDEQRHQMFARDEEALVSEIEKVRKDIEVWQEVRTWHQSVTDTREVTVKETMDRFKDRRWGGRARKVGGIIDEKTGQVGVVIDEEFRKSKTATVIQGYNIHEEYHKNTRDNISFVTSAVGLWKSIRIRPLDRDSVVTPHPNPFSRDRDMVKIVLYQNWTSAFIIEDEIKAYGVQKAFYERSLASLRAERSRTEQRLKALRARFTALGLNGGTHTVEDGESLSKIAQLWYQDMFLWPLIWEANASDVTDPDRIRPKQVLKISPLRNVSPEKLEQARRRAREYRRPPVLTLPPLQ